MVDTDEYDFSGRQNDWGYDHGTVCQAAANRSRTASNRESQVPSSGGGAVTVGDRRAPGNRTLSS